MTKVLMLGWEFPPFISGGLGTACYGLTKALSELGTEISFLVPRPIQSQSSTHVKLLSPGCSILSGCDPKMRGVKIRGLDVRMYPYVESGYSSVPVGEAGKPGYGGSKLSPMDVGTICAEENPGENYGSNLYSQTCKYSKLACNVSRMEEFDVIHAHDWMTFPAGIATAKISGNPLVVHVHSTEFDRSGENVNQWIYELERQGMHRADRVITVSQKTRNICIEKYGVPEVKLSVIYNGVENSPANFDSESIKKDLDEKIVLFLGRITMQKGPEYFIAAAKKVLEKMEQVKFIMAGSGDMYTRAIEMAAGMGIGHKVLFSGFLRQAEVNRIFRMADLYVMPSVSEPFGISPLEAMVHNVPVLISKQSGVAEILNHALKVDFWDINEMANKILGVLRHRPLQQVLCDNGAVEVRRFQWSDAAHRCKQIYNSLANKVA